MPEPDTSAMLLAGAELVSVDRMLEKYVGEFGAWQIRNFLLASLAWALNAFHMLVVVFADREPDDSAGSGRSSSTVSEWGLVGPNRFKVGLAQSAFFVGSTIGAGIFGHFSDSVLGRKRTLVLTTSMNSTFGILTSLSPSFPSYAVLRFLTGLSTGGAGPSAFVLATEPVGPTRRGPVALSAFCFFPLGAIALALLAHSTPSWRPLYAASSAPSLAFALVVLLFAQESPRWHLVHGDVRAAMRIMRSIAKANGRHLPDGVSLTLEAPADSSAVVGDGTDPAKFPSHKLTQPTHASTSIVSLAGSPAARSRLGLLVVINFLISVAYYGLTLNVRNLSTNLYLSVVLNAVAEMPAYAATTLFVKQCGRRPLTVTTAWLAAAFCIAASAVDKAARTACGMAGIFFVTATFNLLFIYTAELFPTTMRSTALGIVTQAGQMGAVAVPMVVTVGRDWPFMVFGACGLVGGAVGLGLPETLNRPLHETMEGLEREERGKQGRGSEMDGSDLRNGLGEKGDEGLCCA